jgi:TolB-like protein
MTERRLAAILVADVVGYSKLIGSDEAGTLAKLDALRTDVIAPQLAKHAGRLFKAMGDGFLIEFASAVQAVSCAKAIQDANETGLPLRIGIHVGDVVVQGDDLMGDGVNIAARIESLADSGGIAVSRAVHEQVRDKLDLAFVDKGEMTLKNIARPVQVFVIRGAKPAASPSLPALRGKPSIAVLPFQNMSGDPEQEYFADGMVEDIITALSRFKSLFVIARNASFTFKGKAIDIREVGRELGVRYVLEGSVRKAGNRLRITGQLIEVSTLAHIWADRFDGRLDDVFELQDQVTESVVGALAPKLDQAEIDRARRKPVESLDAYDWFLRGMAKAYEGGFAAWQAAMPMFQRAMELDPDFASPYGLSTRFYSIRKTTNRVTDKAVDEAEVRRLASRVAAIGKDDPLALCWAGHSLLFVCGDHDAAETMVGQAIALNPNVAACWQTMGSVSMYGGDHAKAIEQLQVALRFNPVGPDSFHIEQTMSAAYYHQGQYADSLLWANKALAHLANSPIALQLAANSLALSGNADKAKAIADRVVAAFPTMSVTTLKDVHPMRRLVDRERWIEGLRAAGFPE